MLLATARERSSTLESAVRDRYMAAVARGPPDQDARARHANDVTTISMRPNGGTGESRSHAGGVCLRLPCLGSVWINVPV